MLMTGWAMYAAHVQTRVCFAVVMSDLTIMVFCDVTGRRTTSPKWENLSRGWSEGSNHVLVSDTRFSDLWNGGWCYNCDITWTGCVQSLVRCGFCRLEPSVTFSWKTGSTSVNSDMLSVSRTTASGFMDDVAMFKWQRVVLNQFNAIF